MIRSNLKILFLRLLKFGFVGGLGTGVNLVFYLLFFKYFGFVDFVSRALAIELAVLHNFTWHYRWVWSDRKNSSPGLITLLLRYHLSTLISSFLITLSVGWLILTILPEFPQRELLSHIFGIGCGMISNYLFANGWVFSARNKKIVPENL